VCGAVLVVELPPQAIEALAGWRPEPLSEPVERLHQNLGVAKAAQLPGAFAVVLVLALPDVVPDLIADHTQRGADLLDVLAGLVDRLGGLGAGLAAELRDRVVHPGARYTLDAGPDRLARQQAIGVRIELRSAAVAQQVGPEPSRHRRGSGRGDGGRLAGIARRREGAAGGLLELVAGGGH
jgi:hypothetical protein